MRLLALLVLVVVAGCVTPADDRAPRPAVEDEDGASLTEASTSDETTTAPPPPQGEPRPATPSNGTRPAPASEPAQQPPSNGSEERASSSGPQPFEPEEASQPCDSLAVRSPLVADTTGLAGSWPMRTLDVVMLADPTFVAAHPDDWEELLTALLADASARYEPQLGISLRLALVDRIPEGTLDANASELEILPVARGFMLANHADASFDLVATVVGADYAGTIAGMADCVGGGYTPDTAYVWTEYAGPRASSGGLLFKDTPLKVFMHEAAHLLGAQHHYSNCGEALIDLSPDDATAVCDVMINDISLASFRFGPLNRLVMRSFVEEHGLGDEA